MFDSFGDAWNGAAWVISDAFGELVTSGTMGATGPEDSEEICLVAGCYTMFVGGGTFDSEISWTLHGPFESISGGAPETIVVPIGPDCVPGCFDPTSCNYDEAANLDWQCDYSCIGCMDPSTCNFDPEVEYSDESCCYDNCILLQLWDSMGDGWNGATYTIVDLNSGDVVASGTLESGTNEDVILCLANGNYGITVGGGVFDSEISWILFGTDQGDIEGDAPAAIDFSINISSLQG
jgi:hypothetical protein